MRIGLAIGCLAAVGAASAALEAQVYDFENEVIQEGERAVVSSANFVYTLTGDGDSDNLLWEIKEDPRAPSGSRVLAISKADALDSNFPVALLKGRRFQNGDISVKFKILGGNVNQAGGLMFRAVDVDHSYLCRASALDNSVVLMRVNKRQLTKIAGSKAAISLNRWHTMRIIFKGTQMDVYLDDKKLFTGTDDIYPMGRVGVVSQADSVTHFDDFTVNPLGERDSR